MQKLFFSEPVLLIEMKKIQIFMNKLIYIGLSVLELNKVVMYEYKVVLENMLKQDLILQIMN